MIPVFCFVLGFIVSRLMLFVRVWKVVSLFRHFKGGQYLALNSRRACAAEGVKEGDDLVLYYSLSTGKLWVRPVKSFNGTVINEGYVRPRFKKLT